jgi:hypothetical protein
MWVVGFQNPPYVEQDTIATIEGLVKIKEK